MSNRGLLPITDGQTRRSFNILKGLAKENNVYFLSFYEKPEEIEEQNVKHLKALCQEVEFHPAPSKKISFPMLFRLLRSLLSFDPYTIWRHYSRAFARRVDELIQSGEFDIVHCDMLSLGYTVRFKKGIFRSITDHDVSYLKCLRMSQTADNLALKLFLRLESIKLKHLERKIFNQVDLGIVVSDVDKGELKRICPGANFLVVENGVEVDKFKPSEQLVEPNTIVWVGGFDHHPNREGVLFFLEKIYPLVKRKLPNVKFEIVGGGVTEKIRNLAAADKSIKLFGYVDDPLAFIQKATVFVAPILSGSGTRLKILEAMSTGKAVVTTTVGCEGIPGSNWIHFIIADEPSDFAEVVIKLILDSGMRNRIGQSARQFVVDRYDWKSITQKLNKAYSELCSCS